MFSRCKAVIWTSAEGQQGTTGGQEEDNRRTRCTPEEGQEEDNRQTRRGHKRTMSGHCVHQRGQRDCGQPFLFLRENPNSKLLGEQEDDTARTAGGQQQDKRRTQGWPARPEDNCKHQKDKRLFLFHSQHRVDASGGHVTSGRPVAGPAPSSGAQERHPTLANASRVGPENLPSPDQGCQIHPAHPRSHHPLPSLCAAAAHRQKRPRHPQLPHTKPGLPPPAGLRSGPRCQPRPTECAHSDASANQRWTPLVPAHGHGRRPQGRWLPASDIGEAAVGPGPSQGSGNPHTTHTVGLLQSTAARWLAYVACRVAKDPNGMPWRAPRGG